MWSGGVCVYAKVRLSERYRQKESGKKAKRKKKKKGSSGETGGVNIETLG